jgi:invasion protein IalB
MLSWRTWIIAIIAACLGAGASVPAAPQNGQAFRDWMVTCEGQPDDQPGADDGAAPQCYIVQNIALKESGQRLLHVAVGYPPQRERPAAIITLPLGIFLPAGIGLAVDDGEPLRVPVQHCLTVGCRALLALDENLVSQLKAGHQARITFQDSSRREIGVPVSLLGFTAGLRALGE